MHTWLDQDLLSRGSYHRSFTREEVNPGADVGGSKALNEAADYQKPFQRALLI
jgi:hypothetical protein